MTEKTLRIKLVKSLNGRLADHKACAHGLGLRKIGQENEVQNTDANRGMIKKISYLLQIMS
ncbi:MAG: 50S ribosomal protein L30 [Pseudomonadota bacterium]|jgi:large subunit ribosomal protein L30|nr:50S ribosomal protein L30 [Pseudomonadota bacterium]